MHPVMSGLPLATEHLPVVDAGGNLLLEGAGSDGISGVVPSPLTVAGRRVYYGARVPVIPPVLAAALAAVQHPPGAPAATAAAGTHTPAKPPRRPSTTSVGGGAAHVPHATTPAAATAVAGVAAALAAMDVRASTPLPLPAGADPRTMLLEPGDVVLAINGVHTKGSTLQQVAQKLAARTKATGAWVTVARPIGRMVHGSTGGGGGTGGITTSASSSSSAVAVSSTTTE